MTYNIEAINLLIRWSKLQSLQIVRYPSSTKRLIHRNKVSKETALFKAELNKYLEGIGVSYSYSCCEFGYYELTVKTSTKEMKAKLISIKFEYNAFQDAWIKPMPEDNVLFTLIFMLKTEY